MAFHEPGLATPGEAAEVAHRIEAGLGSPFWTPQGLTTAYEGTGKVIPQVTKYSLSRAARLPAWRQPSLMRASPTADAAGAAGAAAATSAAQIGPNGRRRTGVTPPLPTNVPPLRASSAVSWAARAAKLGRVHRPTPPVAATSSTRSTPVFPTFAEDDAAARRTPSNAAAALAGEAPPTFPTALAPQPRGRTAAGKGSSFSAAGGSSFVATASSHCSVYTCSCSATASHSCYTCSSCNMFHSASSPITKRRVNALAAANAALAASRAAGAAAGDGGRPPSDASVTSSRVSALAAALAREQRERTELEAELRRIAATQARLEAVLRSPA